MDEDLVKLRQWAAQFHLFASQQACCISLCFGELFGNEFSYFICQLCSVTVSSYLSCCWYLGCCLQGGLDVAYLAARYQRGKDAVSAFMQKRHSSVQHRNITLAHGDVVEQQANLGPTTFLS